MIPKILTLVRGLPGSGKSTFANNITNEFSVCEADKFFYDKEGNYNFDATKLSQAHKWCKEQVEIRMKDNQINEQAFVGVISFFAMVFVLFVDVITGIIGNELIIKEFIFDGFMLLTLGAFGIASVDKYLTGKNKPGSSDEETPVE